MAYWPLTRAQDYSCDTLALIFEFIWHKFTRTKLWTHCTTYYIVHLFHRCYDT